ncbi:hypothetical protein M422DRAFT_23596 [Sphaerobolus stellatus SS14]|nr:hypothetical protein M422DRAFT_23596 [Sphaerobolus stellatus SS14]
MRDPYSINRSVCIEERGSRSATGEDLTFRDAPQNGLHKDAAIRYMVVCAVEMSKPSAGRKQVYAAGLRSHEILLRSILGER